MRQPVPTPDELRQLDPTGNFRDRLEADRKAIATLSDCADLKSLQLVVHRLAGAAGTFGFAEIGAIAIEIDDHFADGRPVGPPEIAPLLAALERALGKPEVSLRSA